MKRFTRTEALAVAVETDPEGFAKWVAALRSGKYEQIQRKMSHRGRETECGCCLHILQLAQGVDPKLSTKSPDLGLPVGELGHVVNLGGFDVGYGQAAVLKGSKSSKPGRGQRFSMLNDKYDLNFEQIADIIEGKIVELGS